MGNTGKGLQDIHWGLVGKEISLTCTLQSKRNNLLIHVHEGFCKSREISMAFAHIYIYIYTYLYTHVYIYLHIFQQKKRLLFYIWMFPLLGCKEYLVPCHFFWAKFLGKLRPNSNAAWLSGPLGSRCAWCSLVVWSMLRQKNGNDGTGIKEMCACVFYICWNCMMYK